MGFIPEIKCARCDRRYSGLRRRCPYCGARRNRGGKRMAETDNGMLRVIVGGILLLAILVAVIVIIANSLKSGDPDPGTSPTPPVNTADVSDDPGVSNTPDVTDPTDPGGAEASDPPEVSTPVVPAIQSITLNRQDFTLRTIGEQWNLGATVTPSNTELTITWASTNSAIASVNQDGTVTAISKGMVTVTATIGDKTAECIVRVTADVTIATATPSAATGTAESGGLTLSHDDVTLNNANGLSFSLKVSGATGTPTYSSSNSAIVTVSEGGTVTGVASGTATITVVVDGVTLKCTVRVSLS